CTSWMKSTPGSDRASPLHGHVKFVPSIKNVFSLVPEPNADTLLVDMLPGEVGETPGAALTKSNILKRRVGIALRSSGPKRVSNPLPRASRREPEPSTTTDSTTVFQIQEDASFDGGAESDLDAVFVIALESVHFDVEGIGPRRQSRKSQLALLIRCRG